MKVGEIRDLLMQQGLKVTPQRIAILEAVNTLNNHPTAEKIIEYIGKNHPNIATGTVYKILEVLSDKGLIRKVKTDRDVMRYDPIMEKHHHLYCSHSDRIEDYFDSGLDRLLEEYFRKKTLKNFRIEDIKLQIIGRFKDKK